MAKMMWGKMVTGVGAGAFPLSTNQRIHMSTMTMENYQDRTEALIAGLYQKAIKERNYGDTTRLAYLRRQSQIAGENPVELGFFINGDTIGYTPHIEVSDVTTGFVSRVLPRRKRPSQLVLGTAGFLVGAWLGLSAARALEQQTSPLELAVVDTINITNTPTSSHSRINDK